jgi:hypothetical protein
MWTLNLSLITKDRVQIGLRRVVEVIEVVVVQEAQELGQVPLRRFVNRIYSLQAVTINRSVWETYPMRMQVLPSMVIVRAWVMDGRNLLA